MAASIQVLPIRRSDPWPELWASFERALRARLASPNTIRIYAEGGQQAYKFFLDRSLPTDPSMIERRQIEAWLAHLQDKGVKPATIAARYSALKRFFSWLLEEEEIAISPMERIKAPKVEVIAPEVLSDDEHRRLLDACRGGDFEDKRDAAILRLMMDTGLRRGEVAGMKVSDVDLDNRVVRVIGKGNREATVPFGIKAAADLDRYRRARGRHAHAGLDAMWLAVKGPLSGDGLLQMLQRRARKAGIARHLHPHLLRHSWAHTMKSQGASDEDVMTLGRWRDRNVMARYGASVAIQRARETHRRLSPGDRL